VVLRGHVTEHHRWMLRRLLEELKFLENEILCLEQQLARDMEPYQAAVDWIVFRAASQARTRNGFTPASRVELFKKLGTRGKTAPQNVAKSITAARGTLILAV